MIDAVELLASEIVTNALLHVGAESELVIRLSDETVRVEVTDHDDRIPEVRTPRGDSTHGRGLVILSAVADAWGVDALPDNGKTVWFELQIDA